MLVACASWRIMLIQYPGTRKCMFLTNDASEGFAYNGSHLYFLNGLRHDSFSYSPQYAELFFSWCDGLAALYYASTLFMPSRGVVIATSAYFSEANFNLRTTK